MYATIRNYAGGRDFADALAENQNAIHELLTGIEGFRAYYVVRDERRRDDDQRLRRPGRRRGVDPRCRGMGGENLGDRVSRRRR